MDGVNKERNIAACLDALLRKYDEDIARFRSWGDEVRAAILERVMLDVEHVLQAAAAESLTLADASREGGYSERQLRRMLRTGTIQNMGRPNAPRLRRNDIPRKPGYLPPVTPTIQIGRTPGQIARTLSTDCKESK